MAIQGTADAWPVEQRLPRLGQVTVVFGEPLDPQELAKGEDDEPHERMAQALHDQVAAIL